MNQSHAVHGSVSVVPFRPSRSWTTLLGAILLVVLPACDAGEILSLDPNAPSYSEQVAVGGVSIQAKRSQAPGSSYQYSAKVYDQQGAQISAPLIAWESSDSSIARVDANGRAFAIAPGVATIKATSGGVTGTSRFGVSGSPVGPIVAGVSLTPETVQIEAGDTLRLRAIATDAAGKVIAGGRYTIWTSSDSRVGTVNKDGLVTAVGNGETLVTVSTDGLTRTAQINVGTQVVAQPTEKPANSWDRVLANVTINEDVVVPAGERWLIGANVRIAGNLRTDSGTIAMRPGSSLHFLGANPAEYVGGGPRYDARFARDIGLWIGGSGVLDIQGTPKVGWNRTGRDPSWSASDEYWIAPTAENDFVPKRWYPGNTIPQVDPRAPAAEVINVTRDILIEGPGHIHISSSKPQRLEYFTLRRMGIIRPNQGTDGITTSRYALHLHMQGDNARGTVIRGVASIDAGGRVFVPHGSHGVTMIDNVAVNSYGEAFWWDTNQDARGARDRTNDLMVERLAVSGVHLPRSYSGSTSQVDGIGMGGGTNMTMRNSVVSGTRGSKVSNGFHWVSAADNHGSAFWTFDRGNVAHNNEGSGLRFWNNNMARHEASDVITYGHGGPGVENGAYGNANYFENILLIGDDLFSQASGRGLEDKGTAGRPQTFKDVQAPVLTIGHIRLEAGMWQQYTNCQFDRVRLNGNQRQAWHARFTGCNVTPDMIEWPAQLLSTVLNGSTVQIEHADGRRWNIVVQGGQVVVR